MYSDESYDDDGDDGGYEDEGPSELVPCSNCGRNFNPDSVGRHENICKKTKKRRAFDSKKQRTEGFEKPKVTSSQPAAVKKTAKKKDWRRQHEEFIKTIRAARGVTNALKTGGELPPAPEPTFNPDYIQCEYCNRRFAESAAERHINFCKEQKSRLPKASSDKKFDQKKEKQSKRIQYRPPMPGQKKKTASTESPVKPRGSSSSMRSPATKPDNSPGTIRKTSSKSKIARKQQEDERPIPTTNSRYNRHEYSSPEPEQISKTKSGRNKNSNDPGWMADLKRANSGRTNGGRSRPIDGIDSGVGLNEDFEKDHHSNSAKSRGRQHPVGVVRPSSRTKDDDLFSDPIKERSPASAGRRQKMANFCHDCGTKYPVPSAKFCCECGIRRAVIT